MKINYSINISLFTLVSVLMLCFKLSNAQQIPQFTQYILNPFIINPAYAGTTSHFDFKASYRKQWMGPLPKQEQIP